jgi:hypothetical protein
MTTVMTRDVHPTKNTDHTAVARLHTLAQDRLNVEEEKKGGMIAVTMTGVLLANTIPAVAAFHDPQTRAAGESHIPVRDDQIRAHHLASTEIEIADGARHLLCGHERNGPLPRLNVVHHQAMSLTATVVLDHQEPTETIAHPDLTGTTAVP